MIEKYKQIRRDILNASFEASACHLGSSLSCVEILVDLYYKILKPEDVFVFSKASGAATLYAILADKGYFPKEKLAYYLKNFPEASKDVPGVVHSVGSVGHGLAVAVGMAYADRTRNVYCLISDGECQEGTTWEATMFAAHHKLNNLIVFVDDNGLQACGKTEEIMNLGKLKDRFSAFGWNVMGTNNHGIYCRREEYFFGAESKVRCECLEQNKPQVHIVKTIKGKGVDFMENDYTWHYKNLTPELLERALRQI